MKEKELNKLKEKIKSIPLNTKVTLTLIPYFGGEMKKKATLISHPYHNGYLDSNIDSWSLYEDEDSIKSFEFKVRFYRKRKISLVKVGFDLLNIEEGWK